MSQAQQQHALQQHGDEHQHQQQHRAVKFRCSIGMSYRRENDGESTHRRGVVRGATEGVVTAMLLGTAPDNRVIPLHKALHSCRAEMLLRKGILNQKIHRLVATFAAYLSD
jgi:hypothetical protein